MGDERKSSTQGDVLIKEEKNEVFAQSYET